MVGSAENRSIARRVLTYHNQPVEVRPFDNGCGAHHLIFTACLSARLSVCLCICGMSDHANVYLWACVCDHVHVHPQAYRMPRPERMHLYLWCVVVTCMCVYSYVVKRNLGWACAWILRKKLCISSPSKAYVWVQAFICTYGCMSKLCTPEMRMTYTTDGHAHRALDICVPFSLLRVHA